MGKNVDVKATLRLDDLASALLKRIQEGFRDTSEAAEDSSKTFSEWANDASNVASVLGTNVRDVTARVYEFGKGLLMAAAEGEAADHALAGLISTVQGREWGSALAEAQQLGDELDMIAVNAGVAGDQVQTALQAMLEFTGASEAGVEAAVDAVSELATISGVLGKNTEMMAREYALMTEGTVRVKGQLFQLLQSTGIFGKETKKAAEYWSKITEEDRIRLLAYGLGEVAGKLEDAEPGFTQLLASIGSLWDVAKEKLGEPFTEALSPVLKEVVTRLKASGPAVEAFAKVMAKDVAEWVRKASAEIERGFEYLRTHADEIKDAIVSGAETAKSVVQWILDHKEEIAIAFGAKMIAPTLGTAGSAVSKVYGMGAAAGAPSLGIGAGAAGGAAAVAAFAAAVAAWSLAIDQWSHLMDITQGGMSDEEQNQDARQRYLREKLKAQGGAEGLREWSPTELTRFEELRKTFVESAVALDQDSRAAGELADAVYRAHRAARGQVEQYDRAIAAYEELARVGEDTAAVDFSGMATMFAKGFQGAIGTQNDAVAQYIANLTTKSKELQTALLFSADMTAEGFAALAAMVESKSKEFAEQLRAVGSQKAAAAKPGAPKISMSGGQVFKIQQDFRDQDPDRVAFVFQRDIARAAERRIQASTVSPFGT